MNDEQLDRLIRESLAWQAEKEIAQRQPRRLAVRRLALRLGSSAPNSRPRLRLNATGSEPGTRRMPRLLANVAGLAAVLVAAVLAVGYLLGPGSQFGSSGPLHESQRHGYALRLPDDTWSVTEVPGEWQLGTFLDAESPGSDYFEKGPSAPPQILVYSWLGSQPIPDGMTFDGWLYLQDGVTASAASCFDLQGDYEQIRVGGETARLGVYYCPNFQDSGVGWATVQVLLAHERRGYAMYFWPEQEPDMPPLNDVRLASLRWLSNFDFNDGDPSP